MRLNYNQVFTLLIWLYKTIKEIVKAEKAEIPSKAKHQAVKDFLLPYITKKRLPFSGDDVDSVINGLIWFLNKFAGKRRVSHGN